MRMKIAAVVMLFAFCAEGVTGSCDLPWVKKENLDSCYLFSELLKTWEEAKAYCETNGGYLVQINSKAEDDAMTPAIDKKERYARYSGWWIGLTKSGGAWKWTNDNTSPSYTNFFKKQDKHDDANCAEKMIKKWDYSWYNNVCDLSVGKRPFICEKPSS